MTVIQTSKKRQLEKFIELLAESGNITLSAKGAGISRAFVYIMLERDEAFRTRVDEAKAESIERLEAIARARAEAGSDLLLMFLLKALKPEMYRDKPSLVANQFTNYTIDIGQAEQ
jgi:hypothetical protein